MKTTKRLTSVLSALAVSAVLLTAAGCRNPNDAGGSTGSSTTSGSGTTSP